MPSTNTTPINLGRAREVSKVSRMDTPGLLGRILMAKAPGLTKQTFPEAEDANDPIRPTTRGIQHSEDTTSSLHRHPCCANELPEEPNATQLDDYTFIDIPLPPIASTTPPTGVLPRGLIILHEDSGWEFPQEILLTFNVGAKEWAYFCGSLRMKLFGGRNVLGQRSIGDLERRLAHGIEDVCDVVAAWGRQYFWPRGLLIRVDAPGEAKYGLTNMDIYHKKHIDNASGILSRRVANFENKKTNKFSKKEKHILDVLEDGYMCTRLVLDKVAVLDNLQLAEKRGWISWFKSCEKARKLYRPPPQLESSPSIGLDNDVRNIEPTAPEPLKRRNRWPASKHLFFDRFKGVEFCVPISSGDYYSPHSGRCRWQPDPDSMDQRGGYRRMIIRVFPIYIPFSHRPVLPADETPTQVMNDWFVYWAKWAQELLEKDGYYNERRGEPPVYKFPAKNGLAFASSNHLIHDAKGKMKVAKKIKNRN